MNEQRIYLRFCLELGSGVESSQCIGIECFKLQSIRHQIIIIKSPSSNHHQIKFFVFLLGRRLLRIQIEVG